MSQFSLDRCEMLYVSKVLSNTLESIFQIKKKGHFYFNSNFINNHEISNEDSVVLPRT